MLPMSFKLHTLYNCFHRLCGTFYDLWRCVINCPSALSGCVGRKSPHVQETQVEAGWSWEASDFFFSGWTSMYWKLTSALTNDAWWLILLLQGQFSNMEPTQDDVSPSAVFCPAGPRGGRLHPLSFMVLFCYGSVEHINIPESLSLDRVWCRTATRCTPATSSSRTNTTTFPTTLETKPCSVDAMWTSSSCGSCGEPR